MTTPLLPHADGWSGTDEGVEFKIRPVAGNIENDFLWENSRYQLFVILPAPAADFELRVGGLPLEIIVEGGVLVGQLAVEHTFGSLDIDLLQQDLVTAQASIGVRPRHLDAETDFVQMKADLERVSFSLAYSIWRRAHQQAFPNFTVPQGTPEWLAMLRNGWERIKHALQQIARDPNTELLQIHEVRRADRAGHVNARGMRWLAQHPSAWSSSTTPLPVAALQIGGRYIAPERALLVRREVTLNTPANRALKHTLTRLEARLQLVLQDIDHLAANHFAAVDKAAYVDQLRRILRDSQHYTVHGFLRDVEARAPASSQPVHVVRADPRYRQVFRSLGVLQWGVVSDIGGPIAEMSLKDTWELYEYWVYLFILGLFVSWGWNCISQGALAVSPPGAPILMDLARGERSQSQFERIDPASGQYSLVTLTFHREFPSRRANPGLGRGALTVTRNVDILLEIESAGEMRRIVLDPKYRAELTDGHLMCPAAAVDDMHVYRDAIGRWEMGATGARHFVRALDAAVAVFPSRDEAGAATSIFYESLPDGVGALPLLPPDENGPHLLPDFVQTFVA